MAWQSEALGLDKSSALGFQWLHHALHMQGGMPCSCIVSPDLAALSPGGAVSVVLALAGIMTVIWRQLREGMFRVSAV